VTVLRNTSAGLETWTKLGSDLDESQTKLDTVIARLDKIAADVESGKGTVGKLVTDTALIDATKNLLTHADAMMGQFQSVATNLNLAVKNVQDGTTRVPEITDALANEAKDLPGLVLQTKSSMIEVQRLVEAIQQQWLIRKYVNHTNPPPVRPVYKKPGRRR